MLAVGGIGFSMGATANGHANMQSISEKYGQSPKAWLTVSIVGAFLIDLVNAVAITWLGTLWAAGRPFGHPALKSAGRRCLLR